MAMTISLIHEPGRSARRHSFFAAGKSLTMLLITQWRFAERDAGRGRYHR
jgi:hypothetical protein